MLLLTLKENELKMITIFCIFTFLTVNSAGVCQLRDYGNGGHVCVCNSTYCDKVPQPKPVSPPNIIIYTSNQRGQRFNKTSKTFTEQKSETFTVLINSSLKYQTIHGWGGAFTDSTGINIKSLPRKGQNKLLQSYFSKTGIEYSLCRVPIGGTDFSTRGYSYDDGVLDPALNNFKLTAEDFKLKIPFIKEALNLNKNLQLFASAWTAPEWMKTNNAYNGFGFLKEEMYQPWAKYFLKFFEKYEEQGVRFWGVTTGNEPSLALPFVKINTVGWAPMAMAKWIRYNLGPTIRNSNFSNLKIMILDDQRFFLPWYIDLVNLDSSTRNYIDGIAVHWYYDKIFPASLLTATHDKYPEKFILASEACHGDKPGQPHVMLGSWKRGEEYADDIIDDLNNWVTGWVDWNMALNVQGGPTYIGNFVDSPIIVNSTSGEFYKQPMFYTLGHFSKFVPINSTRIFSSSSDNNIKVVAFKKSDNGTTVVMLNKTNKKTTVLLKDATRGNINMLLSPKSITTILYW